MQKVIKDLKKKKTTFLLLLVEAGKLRDHRGVMLGPAVVQPCGSGEDCYNNDVGKTLFLQVHTVKYTAEGTLVPCP